MSDTIRKGIIDIAPYQNESSLLMVGNVAALSGLCLSAYLWCEKYGCKMMRSVEIAVLVNKEGKIDGG